DDQFPCLYMQGDLASLPGVGAERKGVEVAFVRDGIVLPDGIEVQYGRPWGTGPVGGKIRLLDNKLGAGLFFGHGMGQGVGRAAKPSHGLIVERVDIVEGTVVEEVSFDIPDRILDLSLALRIGFPAEVKAEGLFPCIRPE